MVDKINQSMLSLAENNKDFKTALRFMLKCEIQLLLDRLAELGDESLLVIANKSEESTSHFGSACAETYLKACNGFMNFSIKDTFLKHCLQTTPAASFQTKSSYSGNTKVQNSFMGNVPDTGQSQEQGSPINSLVSSVPGQMINSSASQSPVMMNNASNMGQGQARNTSVSAVTGQGQMLDSVSGMTNQGQGLMMNNMMSPDQVMNNPITGTVNDVMLRAAAMLQMGHNQANMINRQGMGMPSNYGRQPLQTNRFNPYQQQATQHTGMPSNYGRQPLQTNRFNPYQQQATQHTGSSQKQSNTKKQEDIEIKRAVCRHFTRGFCWQGNMCAFLHVHQDPDSSEDKDTGDKKTIDSTTDYTQDSTTDTASSTAFGSSVK